MQEKASEFNHEYGALLNDAIVVASALEHNTLNLTVPRLKD